jgi:hypothetical protein
MQQVRYPAIAEVAQPMLRLAGIRIDTNTNAMHLAASYTSYTIRRLSDGVEVEIVTPSEAKLGAPIWSPDGKQFAFTGTTKNAVELWIATTATGQSRRIGGAVVNAVGAAPVAEWMGDNKTLIARLCRPEEALLPPKRRFPKVPTCRRALVMPARLPLMKTC